MAVRHWTDEMLDRQAESVNQLLEGQRMLVQIYQQEHETRVEADRQFKLFMDRTEQFMERTEQFMEWAERVIEQLVANVEELRAANHRQERIMTSSSANTNRLLRRTPKPRRNSGEPKSPFTILCRSHNRDPDQLLGQFTCTADRDTEGENGRE